ncbi:GDSL-type esterase/lipase family protein [Luteibacter yeojuensis]|uniref:Lectin n=1 Tax=Luteibacter yeojuensis TaxID=345309 RepID=A0A7X5TQE9_9GAMM|nr:GDSL-type esterase/lipase family protein [Luteibacter yeojuensis]NID16010.1 lectin [Luteibacter yeojuensis]
MFEKLACAPGVVRAALIAVLFACTAQSEAYADGLPWIGTWTAAPAPETSVTNPSLPSFVDQTLRQYVFTSIGGSAARLHFSNQYGSTPLELSHVRIAQADESGNVIPGTDVPVTFDGAGSTVIPAGATALSDAIDVVVPANGYMAISAYFPGPAPVGSYTTHVFTEQYMELVQGDHSDEQSLANPSYPSQYFFLTGMDVQNEAALGSVVTIGASITDGFNSTVGANHRWSNYLSRRLAESGTIVGVMNQGLAGGTLTRDNGEIYGEGTLNRYERDVLNQPGVRWVIHTEFNDLEQNNLAQLIAAEKTMIKSAQDRQISYLCSTFPPVNASGAYEATRQGLNAFLRSGTSGCDGLVDQDAALRDPSNPAVLAPAYFGTADGVHPNDAGYQAIADAIDIEIFHAPTRLPPDLPATACDSGWSNGQTIADGTEIRSCNGRYLLGLQGDGNFVLYDGGVPAWATVTTLGKSIAVAQMQPTGNLMLFDVTGRPVWASNTDGHAGAILRLQDDSGLNIFDASGRTLWSGRWPASVLPAR